MKKGHLLLAEDADYVKTMSAWLDDSAATVKTHQTVIANHKTEIALHRRCIAANKTMLQCEKKRRRLALKDYNRWRKKRGLEEAE